MGAGLASVAGTGVGARTGAGVVVGTGGGDGTIGGTGTRLKAFRRRDEEVELVSLSPVEMVVETKTAPKSSAPGK